jgi:hypothetical protein
MHEARSLLVCIASVLVACNSRYGGYVLDTCLLGTFSFIDAGLQVCMLDVQDGVMVTYKVSWGGSAERNLTGA